MLDATRYAAAALTVPPPRVLFVCGSKVAQGEDAVLNQ